MIVFHEGVSFRYLEESMVRVLRLAAIWSSAHPGVDVWVTSANDRQHSERSLHYRAGGLAVDLQTSTVPPLSPETERLSGEALRDMRSLTRYLRGKLDDEGYDLVHGSAQHWRHLHVEFDVK